MVQSSAFYKYIYIKTIFTVSKALVLQLASVFGVRLHQHALTLRNKKPFRVT